MKDRFKFRVWDVDRNTYNNSLQLKIDVTGEIKMFSLDEGTGNRFRESKSPSLIEQSTGFKDCNGKLMFIGDIIKVYLDDDGSEASTCIYGNFVIIDDEGFLCAIKTTAYQDYLDGKDVNSLDVIPVSYIYLNDPKVEIIGNIHENLNMLGVD